MFLSKSSCVKLQDGKEAVVADATIYALLKSTPHSLRSLHFCGVDFSKVHAWTFALLAKLKCLEELYVLESNLPLENASIFARLLSSSFETLTSVALTSNDQVTISLFTSN